MKLPAHTSRYWLHLLCLHFVGLDNDRRNLSDDVEINLINPKNSLQHK